MKTSGAKGDFAAGHRSLQGRHDHQILALTDALGNLGRFELLPGHRFDTVGVAPLIDGIAFGGLIADKAFDSNHIIADLNERGAKIVISQHPRRARVPSNGRHRKACRTGRHDRPLGPALVRG